MVSTPPWNCVYTCNEKVVQHIRPGAVLTDTHVGLVGAVADYNVSCISMKAGCDP